MAKWIDRWYNLLHPTTKTDARTRADDVDDAARTKSTPATARARVAPIASATDTAHATGSSQRVPVRRTSSITLHICPKRAGPDTEVDSLLNMVGPSRSADCDDAPTTRTLGGGDDPDRRQPRHSETITGSSGGGQDVKNVQDDLSGCGPLPFQGSGQATGTTTRADSSSRRLTLSTTSRHPSYTANDCSASSSPAISRPSSLRAWSSIAESPSDEDHKLVPSSSIRIAPDDPVEAPSAVTVKESHRPLADFEVSNKSLRRWSIHFNASSWKVGRAPSLPPPPPPPSPSMAGPTTSSLRGQIMGSEFLFDTISKPTMSLRPRSLSTKNTLKMRTRRRKKVFGVGDGDDSHSAGSSDQDERKQPEEPTLKIRQRDASIETQGFPASRCSSPPSTHASSPTVYDESLESRDYFDDRGTSSTGSHGMNVLPSQRKEGEPVRRHSDDYPRYYRAPVARYFAPIATEFAPCRASDGAPSPSSPKPSHNPPFSRVQLSRHQSLGSATQLRSLSPLPSSAESPDRSPPSRSRHQSVTVSFADAPSLPSSTSLSSAFSDSNDASNPPKSPNSLYKMKCSQSRANRRRTQSTGSSGFRGPPPAGHPQLPLLCARVGFARRSATSDSEGPTSTDSQERSIFVLGDGEPTPIVESVYVAKAWSIDTEFAAGSGGEDDGFEPGSNGRKSGTTLQVINPDDASSGGSTPILSPHSSPFDPASTGVPNPISTSSSSNVSSADSTPKTTPTPTPNLMSSTSTSRAISYFPTPSPPLSALTHRSSKDPLDSSIPFPTSPLHHQAVGIAV